MTEEQTIIIDNGSDSIKAGFAGEDLPRVVFPTVVANLRTSLRNTMPAHKMHSKEHQSSYVGNEAVHQN